MSYTMKNHSKINMILKHDFTKNIYLCAIKKHVTVLISCDSLLYLIAVLLMKISILVNSVTKIFFIIRQVPVYQTVFKLYIALRQSIPCYNSFVKKS